MATSRNVLCFDVASGGVSGSHFDENLNAVDQFDVAWNLRTLAPSAMRDAFRSVIGKLDVAVPAPAAISIDTFMHGFLVVDRAGEPLGPLHTWMDNADESGIAVIRRQLGDSFHERTGCRYHPTFPVFKLAGMRIDSNHRIVSPKTWLTWTLAADWREDFGMASASGLFNLRDAVWDPEILRALNLPEACFPPVSDRETIVGQFRGAPVINGSGDGFMATIGSGCQSPVRIAVTLGTTASARRIVPTPVLDKNAGTFCYRADSTSYLLGCASNNGGNVLDWARRQLGGVSGAQGPENIPIFLPMLHGERSPEWDSRLRASWHDVSEGVTLDAMRQSVAEGVVFNLVDYVEILQRAGPVNQIILSGNGFLEPGIAGILASLVNAEVLLPESFGLATLRGAAVSAWRAIGHDPGNAMDKILENAPRVAPKEDNGLRERYGRYKELRLRP